MLRSRASAPNMIASMVAGHLVPSQVREASIRERSKRRAYKRLRKAASKLHSIRSVARSRDSKRSIGTALSIREPLASAEGISDYTNRYSSNRPRSGRPDLRPSVASTPNTTDLALILPKRQITDDGISRELALPFLSGNMAMNSMAGSVMTAGGLEMPVRKRDVRFIDTLPEPFYEFPLPHMFSYAKHLQCAAELRQMGRSNDIVASLNEPTPRDAQCGTG